MDYIGVRSEEDKAESMQACPKRKGRKRGKTRGQRPFESGRRYRGALSLTSGAEYLLNNAVREW